MLSSPKPTRAVIGVETPAVYPTPTRVDMAKFYRVSFVTVPPKK